MDNTSLFSQDEKIKEFLGLLENNDMVSDKKTVEILLHYIDQMDKQFHEVNKELKAVRTELTNIHDKTIRAVALKTIDNISEKVNTTKHHFQLMKNHVKSSITTATEEFKTKGKEALITAMNKLNVIGALSSLKTNLDKITHSFDKDIDKLTKLGNEIHQVNGHFKNIGRMILGKNTKPINQRDSEKGILFSVQKTLFKVMDKTEKMSIKTNNTINRLNTINKKHENKTSVKSDLNDLKEKKSVSSKMKAKEISR